MKGLKYLTVGLCALFIGFFSVWCIFIETPDYSEGERRQLASFPELTWERVQSGAFAKDFEEYTTDRFPLRESWRRVKAYARLYLFGQEENNGLYTAEGHLSKLEYPWDPAMTDYAATLLAGVREQYFPESKVYLAVIPDKNQYLTELTLDYEGMRADLQEKLPFATPIEIKGYLGAEDYYYTDSHWRQENLLPLVEHLAESMGTSLPQDYEEKTLDVPFYGVYAGQSALACKPDTIRYLTNETIAGLKVEGAAGVYDLKKAAGKDPYEFFLSGNQPLVTLRNPANPEGKKLIVFRDSFASSLTPLLAQGYGEVTLVDLRYIHSSLLGQYVDFTDAEVLFLYSVGILNNATSMK